MDNGDVLALGLTVPELVAVAHKLDNDHVIVPNRPMAVQIVQEVQPVNVTAIPLLALVRMKGNRFVF